MIRLKTENSVFVYFFLSYLSVFTDQFVLSCFGTEQLYFIDGLVQEFYRSRIGKNNKRNIGSGVIIKIDYHKNLSLREKL